jgi:integrase
MGVKVREQRGRLFLDVYWGGKRHWESLGLTLGPDQQVNKETRRTAEIIRQKRELQLVSGEHGLIDPIESKRPIVTYAESLAVKMPPKNPLPKSLHYLRLYAGELQVGAVNERWLEGYQSFLREQKSIGPSTAAKYYSACVFVLNRAVRDLIISRNPADAVRGMITPEVVKIFLDPKELAKLANTPCGGELGEEVKRAFLFGCMTGLRVSDLRSLAWAEIEREPLQILKRQGKTGRVVAIPLNETAWKIINDETIHHRNELVFPRLTASKANTNQYLKTWAKAADVDKPIGWHTARHTFATLTLEGGADFSTVSRLLGHTKLSTTLVYAKSTDGAKRRAVEGLPELDLGEMAK